MNENKQCWAGIILAASAEACSLACRELLAPAEAFAPEDPRHTLLRRYALALLESGGEYIPLAAQWGMQQASFFRNIRRTLHKKSCAPGPFPFGARGLPRAAGTVVSARAKEKSAPAKALPAPCPIKKYILPHIADSFIRLFPAFLQAVPPVYGMTNQRQIRRNLNAAMSSPHAARHLDSLFRQKYLPLVSLCAFLYGFTGNLSGIFSPYPEAQEYLHRLFSRMGE